MDSTRKQTLLYQHFGWTYPETMYWGRVKVHEWGGFSTSQMRRDIEAGLFSGWDDPRLPTLTALRKRGITAKALRDFWVELGVTQKDISVPLSTLFSHNTKSIDDDAPRLAFIRQPEKLHLEGEHPLNVSVEVHPNHSSRGMRIFDVSSKAIWIEHEDAVKNEVRLKGFSNIEINGNLAGIGSIERNDRRPIIHWVPDTNATPAVLLVAEDGEIKRFEGLMEAHTYPAGTMVQLERIGYARIIDNSTLIFTHS
jgi:glutamyl-tRNA synthetase